MTRSFTRRSGAMALLVPALLLGLAACGDNSGSEPSTGTAAFANDPSNFGPGCAQIPTEGPGSFNAMASAPVAAAARTNPALSSLVTAVTRAGLAEDLNRADAITVFAPSDAAFAKLPAGELHTLLTHKAALTKLLKHHVVVGKLAPSQLAGQHTTLAGDKIDVTGSGEDYDVADRSASSTVVCGNVTTANATVYIIDTVLTD